ncbi:MAG TPA: AAA family ATPase, partial [Gemmataceae bacterium]|nr:AAA family ATPase [Gemmataceae bacterium]
LARAFAEELDMPIFVYNLSEMSNFELMKAWSEMQANVPCVALIEDVDNVFHGRENVVKSRLGSLLMPRKKKDKGNDEDDEGRSLGMVSFDCLLNCLDGVERSDGVFTIVTTNDVSKVDPALGQPRVLPDGTADFISTRPGRIDKAIELTYMEDGDKRRMARRILGEYEEEYRAVLDFIDRFPELPETPAQFQERCAQLALARFWEDQQAGPDTPRPEKARRREELLSGV